mmetsp:Transcript_22935/g.39246  ORF Transcript_22935/g.39246 Transcript_22935/m.39246 type:complete len:204 (+) Transcript_22935:345-956(+)|eukprot:CAMPEP_0183705400 /NCGR_PEP_ID=MMETSP0737-20130205/2495_1 /TAXON_ID=385413 /ORGANISM="Thalassiosira miniscula, Strain CCMP1093" /LENGTH=203 /DNA_ID=CAMNT_0025932537 /DNA_START=291 /DNA_END=902 /DNA_ORIENTATION=+
MRANVLVPQAVFLAALVPTVASAFLLPPAGSSHISISSRRIGSIRRVGIESHCNTCYFHGSTPLHTTSLIRVRGINPTALFASKKRKRDSEDVNNTTDQPADTNGNGDDDIEKDTVRVRIWRALASGEELSMTQLSKRVGVRSVGDLKSHLVHVERQAKTLQNKKDDWRERRGLPPINGAGNGQKLRLKIRRGGKKEVFVKLV